MAWMSCVKSFVFLKGLVLRHENMIGFRLCGILIPADRNALGGLTGFSAINSSGPAPLQRALEQAHNKQLLWKKHRVRDRQRTWSAMCMLGHNKPHRRLFQQAKPSSNG